VILVTGATGSVGRQVVEQLVAEGQPVRALARDPHGAALPDGVEVVAGDLSDAVGLAPHLDGVDAVFLLWPFPTVESVRKLGPALIDTLAVHVGRVVYLSATPAADPPGGFWRAVEQLIEASDLQWTHLRPTGFAKNTLIWGDQIRAGDVVRWPYPGAARSLIHESDIAAVAVQALTGDKLVGRMPVITGPDAITQADQVAEIGTAIGRELRYQDMPPDEALAELAAMVGNADFARHSLDVWAGFVTKPEIVTNAVAEIIGEPARPFRVWAAEHTDDFRSPAPDRPQGRRRSWPVRIGPRLLQWTLVCATPVIPAPTALSELSEAFDCRWASATALCDPRKRGQIATTSRCALCQRNGCPVDRSASG